MKDLATLIDRVMMSGNWRSLRVFACDDGTYFVSLGRNQTSFVTDQCTDPNAKPSERIRLMLEAHDRSAAAAPSVDQFEELLG